MYPKRNGLTVGELTMAIGALVIACLIWSMTSKKEASSNRTNALTLKPIAESPSIMFQSTYNNSTIK